MEFSVVIPTFNRRSKVTRAVRSAIALAQYAETEIVVVDDASEDGTAASLRSDFGPEIESGLLNIVVGQVNVGPTAAKNVGANVARGTWIVFLDSDDEFVTTALHDAVEGVRRTKGSPLVFLRCVNDKGELIGKECGTAVELQLHEVVRWRWGECLPIVRRDAFAQFPYDADLRGYEGLSYMRMTRLSGSAVLLPIRARKYDDTSRDRLSSKMGLRSRACLLARGHWRVLREFPIELGAFGAICQCAKIVYQGIECLIWRAGTRSAARSGLQ